MSENQLLLEVILPAYNKGETIVATVIRLRHFLNELDIDFQIHIVIDGPDEYTENALKPFVDSRMRISVFPKNMGKGSALRYGVKQSNSKYIAFLDADLDIHPNSIGVGLTCLEQSKDGNLVCAYGSKVHIDSKVEYPWFRRLSSSTYRLLVSVLFGINVKDTQTGLKVFDGKAIREVIDQSVEQRFLFDLEIFWLLSRNGYWFVQIPIDLDYQFTSTIGVSTISLMIRETFNLARRTRKDLYRTRKRNELQ